MNNKNMLNTILNDPMTTQDTIDTNNRERIIESIALLRLEERITSSQHKALVLALERLALEDRIKEE